MNRRSRLALYGAPLIAVLLSAGSFAPARAADASPPIPARFLGGPKGMVKNETGVPLEGIMVQLVSHDSAIRTTVFSQEDGHYEFPKLNAGVYTLRIALPREYFPYIKDNVTVQGSPTFDDIVLKRITPMELLPPTRDIEAQMSGAEWLMSLSGTGEDKRLLTLNCNFCHSYQQIFRNHYDEHGWTQIVRRMTHGAGSPLILMRPAGRFNDALEAKLVKWLATVRGPGVEDPEFVTLPRAHGRQTRVVITEYELPRLEMATHDVSGDANGNIWYSTHRSSYIGRLDPKTGKVTEFHVPPVAEGSLPGTHWIHVDPHGIVWGSENWAHNIWRLDPKTNQFSRVHWKVKEAINAPMGGNYSLDPEGYIWRVRDGDVSRIDAMTGEIVRNLPTKKFGSTYGSATSADGKYFGGGAWPRDGVVVADMKTGEVYEPSSSPGSGPARGEFDPDDNYWAGGRGGMLVEFNMKEKRIHEFYPPTHYAAFYSARPDKNGEVWAGESHTGRYVRFNPKTGEWVEYVLPEPYGFDRKSWIDESTNPVTVWYTDHDGWIARIQPYD
jgi:streptogramin lyase